MISSFGDFICSSTLQVLNDLQMKYTDLIRTPYGVIRAIVAPKKILRFVNNKG